MLFGDLHQFPPVAQRRCDSLFYPIHQSDSTDSKLGRQIYEQFKNVVILYEQYRVTDPIWQGFLTHLRKGEVTDDGPTTVRFLLLSYPPIRFH